jgi:hypothetical protein
MSARESTRRSARPGRRSVLLGGLALLSGVSTWAQDKGKGDDGDKPKGRGDDRARGAGKVEVRVLAIRATMESDTISPELRGLSDKLKKSFRFKGYRLDKKSEGGVAIGESLKADLIENYRAVVTPEKRDGKRITLKIKVTLKDEAKLSTTVTLESGGDQLLGGWKLENGDTLIMAVSAR